MNTQAAKDRRTERLAPPPVQAVLPAPGPVEQTPLDPSLFDTEALLNELDHIREAALRIPLTNHETHFATMNLVDRIWRLREHLRETLKLRTDWQHAWSKDHAEKTARSASTIHRRMKVFRSPAPREKSVA